MPRHIGIVACTAEGAALCYRTICLDGEALLGPGAHPEVSLHGHSFAAYAGRIAARDWGGVAELLLSSARKLAAAGADFLVAPVNTVHEAFPLVEPHSPLPWLHIAAEVASEARRRGHRRLGVLGTRATMEGPVYREKLDAAGLEHRVPGAAARERLERLIFEELVKGHFLPAARERVVAEIAALAADGCDAVVLACTELPLLVADDQSPLPALDSTRLLARAALRRAVAE
jgi:aspartate racemase